MAINKKLIFWKSSTFNPPTSPSDTTKDVLWNSIVFFDSTAGTYANSIWTHGKTFSPGTWGTDQTNYIPLTISGTTYNLSKNGHTHSYAGSATVGGSAYTSKALIGDDTRSTNSAPSVYMSGGARYVGYVGNQTEFKGITAIGAETFLTGSYCFLETKNPWSDISGGLPIQVAYGPGTPCWRIARFKFCLIIEDICSARSLRSFSFLISILLRRFRYLNHNTRLAFSKIRSYHKIRFGKQKVIWLLERGVWWTVRPQ